MDKSEVNFEAVQESTPVATLLWDSHLTQIAYWVIEDYLGKNRLKEVDKEAPDNTTIDIYGQKT